MAFQFANPSAYEPGQIFLGLHPHSNEDVGIPLERHLITIAGSGTGKGAALIIPNLKRWTHNALVIDPKGENAEQTWADREAMGQAVHVLDPFKVADVPDRLRSTLNPLSGFNPSSPTIREDIRAIADGLVIRYKNDDGTWDDGAVSVLAGILAHAVASGDPAYQTIPAARSLLRLPDDDLESVFQSMALVEGMGELARNAASIGLGKSKTDREFVSGAKRHSEWLDSGPMKEMLSSSSFDLSDLKLKPTTVFLVLPPEYLAEHSRFLRLFVRCALNAMSKGGQKGRRCLFILDEFFSLGRIDEIAKAAGLMRSYGVHLWPFLQDLGQLQQLYTVTGAETFFGNSDATVFFGNTDQLTLEYASVKLGIITPDEVGPPPDAPFPTRHDSCFGNLLKMQYQTNMNNHQHRMAMSGRRRLSPEEIKEVVAKYPGMPVAQSMIVFAHGNQVFWLRLSPYFLPHPEIIYPEGDNVGQAASKLDLRKVLKYFSFSWIIWLSLYPLGFVQGHNGLGGVTAGAFILTVIFMLAWAIIGGQKNLPRLPAWFLILSMISGCVFISSRFYNWHIAKMNEPLAKIFLPSPTINLSITMIWAFSLITIWCYFILKWPHRT